MWYSNGRYVRKQIYTPSTSHQPASSFQPPLSLIPELPNLVFALAFLPPSSLYISLISTLPGLATCASNLHCSSLSSRGVWYPVDNKGDV